MQTIHFPMGTLIRITDASHGLLGNVGRIYGQCRGTDLYNIACPRGLWWGKPMTWSDGSVRGHDVNLFPHEFEVVFEEG